MRVKEGDNYVLVGSQGGAPTDPAWVHNLRADLHIELRDEAIVRPMRVREVKDAQERDHLWMLAVGAYRHTPNIRRARNVKFQSLSPSPKLQREEHGLAGP